MIKLYSVDHNVVYSRTPVKSIWLKVTKESNFIVLWVGRCKDAQPWDESDWEWSAEEFFQTTKRNDAIERCVIRSLEFAKAEAK